MLNKKLFFFMFFLFASLCGCSTNQYDSCKPVLMPYGEYSYKAESKKLSGDFFQKADEIIYFHGLKVAVPQGWGSEKVSAEKAIKFFNNKNRFLLIFEKNINIRLDTEFTNMIGCKNFVLKNQEKTKTQKEFYTDLYLFTDDKLNSDPIFWQYHILWCKTEFLRNTDALFYYTGDNLEAFQRNYRQSCKRGSLLMQSEIFPESIAPDYLVIASRFKDNSFFVGFIEMLNAMNPID